MAESEGFEPSIGLTLYALSRGAPSATRPTLHYVKHNISFMFLRTIVEISDHLAVVKHIDFLISES